MRLPLHFLGQEAGDGRFDGSKRGTPVVGHGREQRRRQAVGLGQFACRFDLGLQQQALLCSAELGGEDRQKSDVLGRERVPREDEDGSLVELDGEGAGTGLAGHRRTGTSQYPSAVPIGSQDGDRLEIKCSTELGDDVAATGALQAR